MFKKLGKKVVADTKEIVSEELQKTGKTVKDMLVPLAISFGLGLGLGLLLRSRSTTAVVVKVATKAVR